MASAKQIGWKAKELRRRCGEIVRRRWRRDAREQTNERGQQDGCNPSMAMAGIERASAAFDQKIRRHSALLRVLEPAVVRRGSATRCPRVRALSSRCRHWPTTNASYQRPPTLVGD